MTTSILLLEPGYPVESNADIWLIQSIKWDDTIYLSVIYISDVLAYYAILRLILSHYMLSITFMAI